MFLTLKIIGIVGAVGVVIYGAYTICEYVIDLFSDNSESWLEDIVDISKES
jgi:hypothetical protein